MLKSSLHDPRPPVGSLIDSGTMGKADKSMFAAEIMCLSELTPEYCL